MNLLDDGGIGDRFPAEGKIFLYSLWRSHCSGIHQASCTVDKGKGKVFPVQAVEALRVTIG
jgi:hypothetical protein